LTSDSESAWKNGPVYGIELLFPLIVYGFVDILHFWCAHGFGGGGWEL